MEPIVAVQSVEEVNFTLEAGVRLLSVVDADLQFVWNSSINIERIREHLLDKHWLSFGNGNVQFFNPR